MGRRKKNAATDLDVLPILAEHLRGRVRWNSYRRRYQVRGADDTWYTSSVDVMTLIVEATEHLPDDDYWGPVRRKSRMIPGSRQLLDSLRLHRFLEMVYI